MRKGIPNCDGAGSSRSSSSSTSITKAKRMDSEEEERGEVSRGRCGLCEKGEGERKRGREADGGLRFFTSVGGILKPV